MDEQDRLEIYRRQYAALRPGWRPATARYEQRVAAMLDPNARVLDLGCGRGGIVERLATQGHWVGIDPDLRSLRTHRVPTLPRGQALAHRLPFADRTFDLVVSSWVFEHLPDPKAVFDEVARVLRPGGRLVFLTPNGSHPIPRLSRCAADLTRLQARWVRRTYNRAPQDTFPVAYRANTFRQIDTLAVRAGLRLREIVFVDDPSYLAWNRATFGLAIGLTALLPASWKVHLVGIYERASSGTGGHRIAAEGS
jgi:ubiquinone/menaquinone biosynthesis C-methylase UbiE